MNTKKEDKDGKKETPKGILTDKKPIVRPTRNAPKLGADDYRHSQR